MSHSAIDSVIAKQLLYCWVSEALNVLVPKQRGAGFVKVPYGHHRNVKLDILSEAAGCELFGLDGALEFQCGGKIFHGGSEVRNAFVATVLPLLEKHYGVPAREIDVREFWRLHPVSGL